MVFRLDSLTLNQMNFKRLVLSFIDLYNTATYIIVLVLVCMGYRKFYPSSTSRGLVFVVHIFQQFNVYFDILNLGVLGAVGQSDRPK